MTNSGLCAESGPPSPCEGGQSAERCPGGRDRPQSAPHDPPGRAGGRGGDQNPRGEGLFGEVGASVNIPRGRSAFGWPTSADRRAKDGGDRGPTMPLGFVRWAQDGPEVAEVAPNPASRVFSEPRRTCKSECWRAVNGRIIAFTGVGS